MLLIRIEDYMFSCTYKKIFGVECFGCGAQRATALLFKGEFIAAFKMYPAIYTLALLALLIIFNFFIKFKFDYKIKMTLVYINVAIVFVSYFLKMTQYH